MAILDFRSKRVWLQVAPILPSKFRVNWPFRSEVKNGGSCGHLELSVGTILAIYYLQVTSTLPTKFGVNWPFGSGEVQKRF